MKKLISGVAAVAMAMTLATGVFAAEWHPSRTQTGASLAGSGATVTNSSGEKVTLDSASGSVRITNVADTLSGTSSLDAATNGKTNVVYHAALATNSTTTLVNKFSNAEDVKVTIAEQIAANKEAKVTKLNAKREELSASVEDLKANGGSEAEIAEAEAALAAVDAQIAATESADYDSMDNYEPAALFDVSVDTAVTEQLSNGGSIEIPITVDGVNEDSDVLALHFMGDLTDADTLVEDLQSNPDATVDEMSVEVLPCVPGDGMVTVTMTSFSPVMILVRAEAEAAVTTPEEAPAGTVDATPTPAPEETVEQPETDGGVSPWVYVAIVVVVVVVAGGVVVATRKKKTVTTNKK